VYEGIVQHPWLAVGGDACVFWSGVFSFRIGDMRTLRSGDESRQAELLQPELLQDGGEQYAAGLRVGDMRTLLLAGEKGVK
jgi:hypothetical protein